MVIDKSGANLAGLQNTNWLLLLQGWFWLIEILQVKYLNNMIEQDHRFIKKLTRPMKGFKSFRSASATLDGIEVAHMIRKQQFPTSGQSAFQQFAALAASLCQALPFLRPCSKFATEPARGRRLMCNVDKRSVRGLCENRRRFAGRSKINSTRVQSLQELGTARKLGPFNFVVDCLKFLFQRSFALEKHQRSIFLVPDTYDLVGRSCRSNVRQ
uniref:DDE domain protein n=1 Tax=Rhizobium rhizogenes TaxID=359 RepID=A0A7S5DQP0_RHIRH|nr:DDE domain protein [Rhizobium rhizogenes]QCL09716.1 DDE domain protein [Rhizobium rhizogenes]QCL10354.1 DDE domain protein [Rhizobium rhizogenes]QCL10509.1 DDE domain protein [Rhizobium rhizogenes]